MSLLQPLLCSDLSECISSPLASERLSLRVSLVPGIVLGYYLWMNEHSWKQKHRATVWFWNALWVWAGDLGSNPSCVPLTRYGKAQVSFSCTGGDNAWPLGTSLKDYLQETIVCVLRGREDAIEMVVWPLGHADVEGKRAEVGGG